MEAFIQMLTEKRHSLILSMLEEKGALSVTELVEQLNTSESTIRRDLVTLDRGGWLKKVHGGAVKPDSGVIMTEPNVTDKKRLFIFSAMKPNKPAPRNFGKTKHARTAGVNSPGCSGIIFYSH